MMLRSLPQEIRIVTEEKPREPVDGKWEFTKPLTNGGDDNGFEADGSFGIIRGHPAKFLASDRFPPDK